MSVGLLRIDHVVNIITIRVSSGLHSKVNLMPHLVLLSIKNKVALAETSRHAAYVLNAFPVLFPNLVCFYQLILQAYKNPHLLCIRVVFVIIELDCVRVLNLPLLVLPLLHLVLEGAFLTVLLAPVSVLVELLLHFLDEHWLDKEEILIDYLLYILNALDQEILVVCALLLSDTESV